jgi:hypothetical protein
MIYTPNDLMLKVDFICSENYREGFKFREPSSTLGRFALKVCVNAMTQQLRNN